MEEDAFNHSHICRSQHLQLHCFELTMPHPPPWYPLHFSASSHLPLHISSSVFVSLVLFFLLLLPSAFISHQRQIFQPDVPLFLFFKPKIPILKPLVQSKCGPVEAWRQRGQAASPTHCYVPSVLKAGKEVWDLMRFKCVWIKNLSQQASLPGNGNTVHVSSC